MTLRLLLDEHISPIIAEQIRLNRGEADVLSLQQWEQGAFLSASDHVILTQAAEDGLTLVTYDQRTITPLLKEWSEAERHHGGVIFIDWRTIVPNDFDGLTKALCTLWDAQSELSWTDRVIYLQGV